MTLEEFQNHTSIYPDAMLFVEIQEAFGSGNWADVRDFCGAYLLNTNGIAEEIRADADDHYIALGEELSKLRIENRAYRTENAKLHSQLAQLARETAELEQVAHTDEILLKADMMDSLIDTYKAMETPETVFHIVVGFTYLLEQLCKGRDA